MEVVTPAREKKIKNAIYFFAREHERLTHEPLTGTFLYKYLAFLDFASLERIGRPALGLLYSVFVPDAEGRYSLDVVEEPDLTCFSRFELSEMKRLVLLYAGHFATASAISRESHWPTGPSRMTARKCATLYIDNDNPKEGRQTSGLHFLMQRYMKQLEDLETRVKEVKYKLETVVEASRLLAEEGLEGDVFRPFQGR